MKKLLLILTFFSFIISSQNSYSKPIPPGSGAGDVPANILILLDSSMSMKAGISGVDDAIAEPSDVVELSDGNIIIAQGKSNWIEGGLVKVLTSSGEKDDTFAEGNVEFVGKDIDPNCVGQNSSLSKYSKDITLDVSSNVKGITGEVIFVSYSISANTRPFDDANGKVLLIDHSGKCIDVIDHNELGAGSGVGFNPYALTIKTIGGEDHLFVSGKRTSDDGNSHFYSKNLTTGDVLNVAVDCKIEGDSGTVLKKAQSLTVDDGNYLYATASGSIFSFKLKKIGNNLCPITDKVENQAAGGDNKNYYKKFHAASNCQTTSLMRHCKTFEIQIDPQDPSIMYIVSKDANKLQKVEIFNGPDHRTDELRPMIMKGIGLDLNTTSDTEVRFNKPVGIYVSSTKIWVTDGKPSVQQFQKDANLTWVSNFGGKGRRIEGAISAINALVSDSAFTSTANFGYGYWNSGEHDTLQKDEEQGGVNIGGSQCYKTDLCDYYRGWNEVTKQSQLCNVSSCLKVEVSSNSYSKIPEALANTSLSWGTDAWAFASMAYKYFTDPKVNVIDPTSPCQLNYVIVISDGEWVHHTQAMDKITELRNNFPGLPAGKGVKTLVVAYGGGLDENTIKRKFKPMAQAGSCDDPSDSKCHELIIADTPEELKTQLSTKVHQIIAERISFTAPSVTATIQEGGSLYQAQFNYEQHQEWKGTILRKTLNPDGTVNHDPDAVGNWDAAEKIKAQTSRNIWTTLPDASASYIGNWNNFNITNKKYINDLFILTGNTVLDYHNSSTICGGIDGNEDDIEGLINFVRGKDYFAYDGCANMNLQREHVLGDVYNSQLIEVGPPNAEIEFNSPNEEAYFRKTHNYQSFSFKHATRKNIIYVGANDGMLHAIDAITGEEEWAFIPPFIVSKLPNIVNPNLNGKMEGNKGGSNAIFGVDGTPVVHDMFIRGYDQDGKLENDKNWHTILMVPYGRGGAGFSVLDVTNTLLGAKGPIHMYSIYNDAVNNIVYYADKDGNITPYSYISDYYNINESREARKADRNQSKAEKTDPQGCTTAADCIEQVRVSVCETSVDFHQNGNTACYIGNTFTFDFVAPGTNVNDYTITETTGGSSVEFKPVAVEVLGGKTKIKFNSNKAYNASQFGSEKSSLISIKLSHSLTGVTVNDYKYDYSKLGETWSTPRIFRMPSKGHESNYKKDKYVAVMGGGFGSSKLFVINFEDENFPGSIVGSLENKGPISIIDSDYSDIKNSISNTPIVITPEVSSVIPWRGGLVYINDLEGKITKVNLTNSTKNNPNLYEQATLFKINSTIDNGRYNYFSMDATVGQDSNKFWLYGGTGNFQRVNEVVGAMDNILFGIKDSDYPYFKSKLKVPTQNIDGWEAVAIQNINLAPSIDDSTICKDTTSVVPGAGGVSCPVDATHSAWVVHLDDVSDNKYRKLSGTPTVYNGRVYFPIYKPPSGGNRCILGKSYICSGDDECGTNQSLELAKAEKVNMSPDDPCYFVSTGILSEIVVFGGSLYANVAGPTATEDTLITILAPPGEILINKQKTWRQDF